MRGAFAPVAAVLSSHEGCRSGVCGSRIACLGPVRKGMGITSLGRDARGLTFSVVIPARVMQLGVSTGGKQNWRIALCGYGMTLAPRHRIHLVCVASLAHLRCVHRLGCCLAGLCWKAGPGLAPGPPLKFKVRLFSGGAGSLECLFPYLQKPSQRRASQACPSPLPSGYQRKGTTMRLPLAGLLNTALPWMRICRFQMPPRLSRSVEIGNPSCTRR